VERSYRKKAIGHVGGEFVPGVVAALVRFRAEVIVAVPVVEPQLEERLGAVWKEDLLKQIIVFVKAIHRHVVDDLRRARNIPGRERPVVVINHHGGETATAHLRIRQRETSWVNSNIGETCHSLQSHSYLNFLYYV